MTKRAVSAVLGLLSLSLPLAAQQTHDEDGAIAVEEPSGTASALNFYQPGIFSTVDSSILIHDLTLLSLLDGHHFPISSALGRMGTMPIDLFPLGLLRSADARRVNGSPISGKDSSGEMVDSRSNPVYAGGEVGFFYGRSSGKFGGEEKETYFIGEVGDEKFRITVGAAFQESSGRLPRFGR